MSTSEKTPSTLPERREIENQYKWILEDMYPAEDLWESDLSAIKEDLISLSSFSGKITLDSKSLLDCLRLADKISRTSEKLFVYARMRRDEDNSNSKYQALTDRAMNILTEVSSASSFIEPEILQIEESSLKNYIDEEPGLSIYSHMLDNLLRQKAHTLSSAEEKLLAMTSEFSDAPDDCFTMLNNADIKFPFIKDESGHEVELTKGRYSNFLECKDRGVRESAFKALYSSYSSLKNTLASTLSNNVKTNNFYTKARKYSSCIEASLSGDNVPLSVYENLIHVIHKNLPLLHQYLEIRKKLLKVDKLHLYDLYVPFIDIPTEKISYDDAKNMVLKGVSPLGEDYVNDTRKGFNEGWIDVYENRGKTSGAYSWGAYSSHPYVLLNYQGNINDVFTLAHEMGHSLHSYYTDNTQEYVNSHYKIFVAEVASTVNELLLMNSLLDETADKSRKAYLISKSIDDFRTTVFRQVMFAEFEKIIHAKYESGEALTCDTFCDIYYDLNKQYFGENVFIDPEISFEWGRIPHFYSSFYVYKYATGFSSAVAIASALTSKEENAAKGSIFQHTDHTTSCENVAVDHYKKFLSSGGSDYPMELLKITGVDLSTPAPIENAMNVFKKLIHDLEDLI